MYVCMTVCNNNNCISTNERLLAWLIITTSISELSVRTNGCWCDWSLQQVYQSSQYERTVVGVIDHYNKYIRALNTNERLLVLIITTSISELSVRTNGCWFFFHAYLYSGVLTLALHRLLLYQWVIKYKIGKREKEGMERKGERIKEWGARRWYNICSQMYMVR